MGGVGGGRGREVGGGGGGGGGQGGGGGGGGCWVSYLKLPDGELGSALPSPGSRCDSVVSSVTAGGGWSGLMHNGGRVSSPHEYTCFDCCGSPISVSVLQGYQDITEVQ